MKHALLITLALAAPVHAETVAIIENNAGGIIEFASDQCSFRSGKWQMAYVNPLNGGGKPMIGCWSAVNSGNQVIAEFPGVGVRIYESTNITLTPTAAAVAKRSM